LIVDICHVGGGHRINLYPTSASLVAILYSNLMFFFCPAIGVAPHHIQQPQQ
jgi:hypothetical protein